MDKKLNTAKISGKRLKELRHDYNLTQEALAEKIGACTQTISYIETGKRPLSAKMARTIISTLNIRSMDIDYLLGTQEYQNKELSGFQIWASEQRRELRLTSLVHDCLKLLGYEEVAVAGVVRMGFDNAKRYRFVMSENDLKEKLKSVEDVRHIDYQYYLFNTPYGKISLTQFAYSRLITQIRKTIRFLIEEAFGVDVILRAQTTSESKHVNDINLEEKENVLTGGQILFKKLSNGQTWEEIMPE